MMLLLDFAVGSVNRSGRKKTHGNHSNNNTDREYLSVSNYNEPLWAGGVPIIAKWCSLRAMKFPFIL